MNENEDGIGICEMDRNCVEKCKYDDMACIGIYSGILRKFNY